MLKSIKIQRPLATYLLGIAQKSADKEICGLVAEKDNTPSNIYPIDNIAQSPEVAFEMEPQQLIAAFKNMRTKDERLFAIYHSHPRGPAIPSETDRNNISYPEVYHIVISLNTKGVLEMRAFQLNDNKFHAVDLTV